MLSFLSHLSLPLGISTHPLILSPSNPCCKFTWTSWNSVFISVYYQQETKKILSPSTQESIACEIGQNMDKGTARRTVAVPRGPRDSPVTNRFPRLPSSCHNHNKTTPQASGLAVPKPSETNGSLFLVRMSCVASDLFLRLRHRYHS